VSVLSSQLELSRRLTFATKTVVDSTRPSASTIKVGARSDIGQDMERIRLRLWLFIQVISFQVPSSMVAVTGQQPSGPTGRTRTVTRTRRFTARIKLAGCSDGDACGMARGRQLGMMRTNSEMIVIGERTKKGCLSLRAESLRG
jgi:hypothetical protein